jgi:RNA polymerase sigma-70 factor (ECF subfamily)
MAVRGRSERQSEGERFEELFRREFTPLVQAMTLVAGDREAAADAVQEAFVQAHRHWGRVRDLQSPVGWLRHVALNRVRNQHRGRQREADALPRIALSTGAEESAADAHAEELSIVSSLLERLSPQQRSTAAMFYLLDQPTSSIAEHLGITDATVRSHLRAARQRMQEHLREGA